MSGFGTIFAARRQPDGREAWVIGILSLSEGGLTTVGGKRDAAPGEHKEMVADLRDLDRFPASVELPEAVVADYLYGACALSFGPLAESHWPHQVGEALSVLSRPSGGPAAWREHLVGTSAMTPPGLLRVARDHGHTSDMPEGKDPLVQTTVRVALQPDEGHEVARRLRERRHPPQFVEMGKRGTAAVLEWVKPYASGVRVPAGHKVSAIYADDGGPESVTFRILTDDKRQGMGQIAVSADGAEVEALTLSRASVLMAALLEVADSRLTIVSTDWSPVLPSRTMRS